MMLFKPEHVELILAGRKTQTRRLGKRRWNVGAVHQCATRLFDPDAVFARVRILALRRERLSVVSPLEAWREGYDSVPAYLAAFYRINGEDPPDPLVWVVEFELVEATEVATVSGEETRT